MDYFKPLSRFILNIINPLWLFIRFIGTNINPSLQFCLIVVGLWYTYETHEMRTLYQRELDSQAEQSRIDLKPYIIPEVVDHYGKNRIAEVSGLYIPDVEKTNQIKALSENPPKFTATISNASNRMALNVRAVYYDADTKNFLLSPNTAVVLLKGKISNWHSWRDYLTKEQVIIEMDRLYDTDMAEFGDKLFEGGRHYIAVVYQDKQGRFYFTRRSFSFDSDFEYIYHPKFKSGELPSIVSSNLN